MHTYTAAQLLKILGPWDYFGEVGMFHWRPTRTATVKTVEACDLYMLSRASLEALSQENPAAWETIQKVGVGLRRKYRRRCCRYLCCIDACRAGIPVHGLVGFRDFPAPARSFTTILIQVQECLYVPPRVSRDFNPLSCYP